MAGFTYDNLVTDIRNYTEVDSNVLTAAIVNRIIEDAEFRILRDVPIDAYKKQATGNLVTGQSTINVPAQTLFVKGVQVYDSTSASTGTNTWLEKKDESYLQEYIPAETSTGKPKYYAMFGGATGESRVDVRFRVVRWRHGHGNGRRKRACQTSSDRSNLCGLTRCRNARRPRLGRDQRSAEQGSERI